jgi:multidrug efflux system outer membrane protein
MIRRSSSVSGESRRPLVWLIFTLGCVAWLAGCAVGPNYKRPPVDAPGQFRDNNSPTNSSSTNPAWWDVYQDPVLQSLIREALTNGYDVHIAATRVEQAQALAMQARAQFVPNANYNSQISRGKNYFIGTAFPNGGSTINFVSGTLNASWEVDLWGRVRRLNESARAQFLASEEAQRGVRLSLLSDVASDYFRLLELDDELAIANRTTNSFGESLNIFNQRQQAGTASVLETSRAQAALDDALA